MSSSWGDFAPAVDPDDVDADLDEHEAPSHMHRSSSSFNLEVKKEDLEHAVGALLSMPSSPMPHAHQLSFSPANSVPSTPSGAGMTRVLPPPPPVPPHQQHHQHHHHHPQSASGTPAAATTTTTAGSWNDVDDVDIFTLFLGEMDMDDPYLYGGTTSTTHAVAGGGIAASPLFAASGAAAYDADGGAIASAAAAAASAGGPPSAGYTWADALTTLGDSSSSSSSSAFGFHSSSSSADDFLSLSSYSSPMLPSSSSLSGHHHHHHHHYSPPLPAPSLQAPPAAAAAAPTQAQRRRAAASASAATTTTTLPKPPPAKSSSSARSSSTSTTKSSSSSSTRPRSASVGTLSDDDASAPAASSKSSSSSTQQLSPKSHAIREKNREAVRKCRQKKREREDAVAERIALLEHENEELRIQLRLGSPDRAREMEQESTRRAQRIQDLLANLEDTPQAHTELREACHSYIAHSGERSGDRAAATSGTLSRISRLIDPTLFAKFYLWHGTARDDYFSNPNGLWASISREMQVTDEQTLRLTMRRDKLESLRAEIMDVSCKLADLQSHVALREAADKHDAKFVIQIQSQLSPVQLAKFILWLRRDERVLRVVRPTDVLSSFLTEVMKADPPPSSLPSLLPPSLQQPMPSSSSLPAAAAAAAFAVPPLPAQHQAAVAAAAAAALMLPLQFKKPTLAVSRERVMLLTKGLWDGPKESLEKMALSGFAPDVVLIDPNNGGEYHGIHKMLQYVHRIRLAFGEKISVDLREMSIENDKARATWVLHGTYRGKLSNTTSTGTGTGGKKHLKHVSFAIVCTYTFRPNSHLVQEMLVSWDAIGLMRQIGLLRSAAPRTTALPSTAEEEPAPKRARSTELAELEAITALERHHVDMLAKLFGCKSEDEVAQLASEILHPECVFQDSYMGFEYRGVADCAHYIKRVRSPFPSLEVTSATLREEVEGGGAALGSPLCLNWQISAVYSGPLVKTPSPCNFSCVVFVTFDAQDHTIDSAHLNWHAQKLMDQLKTNKAAAGVGGTAIASAAAQGYRVG